MLRRKRTKAFASAVVRFYVGLDKRREELRVLGTGKTDLKGCRTLAIERATALAEA